MYSIDYLYWNFIGNLLDRDFELVQAPASFGEAWLEARGSAPYDLVRVFRKDIDFRQDLVRDLESLYERAERLRAASGQRKLSILNVYLSQEAPVDEWKMLSVIRSQISGSASCRFLLITLRLKKDYANSPWL